MQVEWCSTALAAPLYHPVMETHEATKKPIERPMTVLQVSGGMDMRSFS